MIPPRGAEHTQPRTILLLRGHPFMTFALEGGEDTGKADEVREASKEGCMKMRTRGPGGGKLTKKFADAIYG